MKGSLIFIGIGDNNPICRPEESKELEKLFKELDANVFTHWKNNGHRLTSTEVEAAAKWYRDIF